MPKKKVINPFYFVLVIVGVAFGITALAYGFMAIIARHDPGVALDSMESGRGLVAFMDNYGEQIMLVELVFLAALTFLAIGTDGFWTRRAEQTSPNSESKSKPSLDEGATK